MDGLISSEVVRWTLALGLAFGAMALELRTGRVPNWLTLGGALPALAAAAYFGRTADAAFGAMACTVIGYAMFRKGSLGGGAVKTLIVVGLAGGAVVGLSLAVSTVFLLAFVAPSSRNTQAAADQTLPVPKPIRSTPSIAAVTLLGLGLRQLLSARGWG